MAIGDDAQLRAIYRESYALWGAGLTERDYVELWMEIRETPWAREHATFYVWLDDRGQLLSSLKLYRPLARIAGRTERLTVVGAIFTPRQLRRNGHATDLVRALLAGHGERWSMLFSDIGAGYYRRLGFRELTAEEHWGNLPRGTAHAPDAPGLRELTDDDLHDAMRAHEATYGQQPLTIVRDLEHWRFLLTRTASYFRRLGDPSVRPRASVAERDGQFLGYLLAVEGRGEWNVREVAAVDGRPETLAAILRAAAVPARAAALKRFYGWFPPGLPAALPDWSIRATPRRRAQPMLRPPVGSPPPPEPLLSSHVPYQDQF